MLLIAKKLLLIKTDQVNKYKLKNFITYTKNDSLINQKDHVIG